MRPLIVLALAPILALGLALSAGKIVPDKAPEITLKPKSIVWSNRVFTSRSSFAEWLGARDASYRLWVKRHPGATWFHKVPSPGSRRAVAAPSSTGPKSSSGGTDLGLVILVGLVGLVLGGALMRILPAATTGGGGRRRRPLRPSPAPVLAAPTRRLALPAPRPTPARTAPVYAPPRVYPAPASIATEPARVVPLYIPPDPEPTLEPEIAPAFEPERVAASMPEPLPVLAPAPPPPEPEPERVLNGELFPAPVAEPAPPPEPEVVPLPPSPSPPVEEPLLEPAAAATAGAPVAEAAPVQPEQPREPEPTLERPARTTVMPASAPAGTDWQTCEIALWEGYVKSQFYARVTTPAGEEYALAFSPLFRVRNPLARDEVARSAHVQLAQQLLEIGWKPDGRGAYWWELRFALEESES